MLFHQLREEPAEVSAVFATSAWQHSAPISAPDSNGSRTVMYSSLPLVSPSLSSSQQRSAALRERMQAHQASTLRRRSSSISAELSTPDLPLPVCPARDHGNIGFGSSTPAKGAAPRHEEQDVALQALQAAMRRLGAQAPSNSVFNNTTPSAPEAAHSRCAQEASSPLGSAVHTACAPAVHRLRVAMMQGNGLDAQQLQLSDAGALELSLAPTHSASSVEKSAASGCAQLQSSAQVPSAAGEVVTGTPLLAALDGSLSWQASSDVAHNLLRQSISLQAQPVAQSSTEHAVERAAGASSFSPDLAADLATQAHSAHVQQESQPMQATQPFTPLNTAGVQGMMQHDTQSPCLPGLPALAYSPACAGGLAAHIPPLAMPASAGGASGSLAVPAAGTGTDAYAARDASPIESTTGLPSSDAVPATQPVLASQAMDDSHSQCDASQDVVATQAFRPRSAAAPATQAQSARSQQPPDPDARAATGATAPQSAIDDFTSPADTLSVPAMREGIEQGGEGVCGRASLGISQLPNFTAASAAIAHAALADPKVAMQRTSPPLQPSACGQAERAPDGSKSSQPLAGDAMLIADKLAACADQGAGAETPVVTNVHAPQLSTHVDTAGVADAAQTAAEAPSASADAPRRQASGNGIAASGADDETDMPAAFAATYADQDGALACLHLDDQREGSTAIHSEVVSERIGAASSKRPLEYVHGAEFASNKRRVCEGAKVHQYLQRLAAGNATQPQCAVVMPPDVLEVRACVV